MQTIRQQAYTQEEAHKSIIHAGRSTQIDHTQYKQEYIFNAGSVRTQEGKEAQQECENEIHTKSSNEDIIES
jgi:hypothetical protein